MVMDMKFLRIMTSISVNITKESRINKELINGTMGESMKAILKTACVMDMENGSTQMEYNMKEISREI